MKAVTFKTARVGMHLVDSFGQRCLIEGVDRKRGEIITRRYEGRSFWDMTAKWPRGLFDSRTWDRLPSGPNRKQKK